MTPDQRRDFFQWYCAKTAGTAYHLTFIDDAIAQWRPGLARWRELDAATIREFSAWLNQALRRAA